MSGPIYPVNQGEAAPPPDAAEAILDRAKATRAERRSAYLGGVPDKHHPDL